MGAKELTPAPWVVRPNWRAIAFPRLTLAEQSLFREAAAAKVRHYVERIAATSPAPPAASIPASANAAKRS